MCKFGQKICRKVDGVMKFFTNMFNPVFSYPPKTLSIAEPSPINPGGSKGSKAEPKRQPLTKGAPKAGAPLEVVKPKPLKVAKDPVKVEPKKSDETKQEKKIICPVEIKVETVKVENLEVGTIKSQEVQKQVEASYKASKQKTENKKIEKENKMVEKRKSHDEHCHDDKEYYCPPFPEVPVVLKGFEWCDYYYYKDEIEKFIDYIKEYQCKYPCVVIKYKKAYISKCKVHVYVWFSLCEYEKAFEIEEKLQKKYRDMKMHYHHD